MLLLPSQIAVCVDCRITENDITERGKGVLNMLHELFRYEESGEEARHVRGTLMRTGRLMHTEKCERAGMNPEKEGSSGL